MWDRSGEGMAHRGPDLLAPAVFIHSPAPSSFQSPPLIGQIGLSSGTKVT